MPRHIPDLKFQVPKQGNGSSSSSCATSSSPSANFGIPTFSKRRVRPRPLHAPAISEPAAVQSRFLERFSLAQRYSCSFRQLHNIQDEPAAAALGTRRPARKSPLGIEPQTPGGSDARSSFNRSRPFINFDASPAAAAAGQPPISATTPRRSRQPKQHRVVLPSPQAPVRKPYSSPDLEKRRELCPWECISPTPAKLDKTARIKSSPAHHEPRGPSALERFAAACLAQEHRLTVLALFVLFTLVVTNLVALDITVLLRPSSNSLSASTLNTIERDASLCLALFDITAPINPSSFPCSSCSSILSSSSLPTALKAQSIRPRQFCAFRDIIRSLELSSTNTNTTASSQAQQGGTLLTTITYGWLQSTDFCSWQGISCDSATRQATMLDLADPNVPSAFPASFEWLKGTLTSLTINGAEQLIRS